MEEYADGLDGSAETGWRDSSHPLGKMNEL
jgi:hypothetical protein